MKKLFLIALLLTSPALGQDASDIQVDEEATQAGVQIAITANLQDDEYGAVVAYPDKSAWFRIFDINEDTATYCWVDEDNEPHCKLVTVEE